ncbi:MAG: hypothetical protein AAGO57_08405 [Pseudomonadota bacterium]
MSTLNGTIGTALPRPVTTRTWAWLAWFVEARRERARILHDYDLLMDMPEYVLRDLGLNRHRIAAERRRIRNQVVVGGWK